MSSSPLNQSNHPCMTCGACCAMYRVSFHYHEMLSDSHGVPEPFTHPISPYQNAMNGTDQPDPLCSALEGTVGQLNRCKIYENRPNCCRLFKASWAEGKHEKNCDEARAGKSLPPLTPADWSR